MRRVDSQFWEQASSSTLFRLSDEMTIASRGMRWLSERACGKGWAHKESALAGVRYFEHAPALTTDVDKLSQTVRMVFNDPGPMDLL